MKSTKKKHVFIFSFFWCLFPYNTHYLMRIKTSVISVSPKMTGTG